MPHCRALCRGNVLAFKSLHSGDGSLSNRYTFWRDEGTGVGATQVSKQEGNTVSTCLAACENDSSQSCAGVAMTQVTSNSTEASIASCMLILVDQNLGQSSRSLIKVSLSVENSFGNVMA